MVHTDDDFIVLTHCYTTHYKTQWVKLIVSDINLRSDTDLLSFCSILMILSAMLGIIKLEVFSLILPGIDPIT